MRVRGEICRAIGTFVSPILGAFTRCVRTIVGVLKDETRKSGLCNNQPAIVYSHADFHVFEPIVGIKGSSALFRTQMDEIIEAIMPKWKLQLKEMINVNYARRLMIRLPP